MKVNMSVWKHCSSTTPLTSALHAPAVWVFIFSGSEVAGRDQVCPWGAWGLLSPQRVT